MSSQDQLNAMNKIEMLCCSLSIAASLALTMLYCLVKQSRNFSFRLVIYLTLSDGLFAFSVLIRDLWIDITPTQECATVYIGQFGLWTSMQISSVISWFLYKTVTKRETGVKQTESKILTIVISISTLALVIPFVIGEMVQSEGSCGLLLNPSEQYYIALSTAYFYGPFWTSIIFNVWCHFASTKYLEKELKDCLQLRDLVKKLRVYPFIMAATWLPYTLFVYSFSPFMSTYPMQLAGVILSRLEGFLNAIYYATIKAHEFKFCCAHVFRRNKSRMLEITSIDSSGRDPIRSITAMEYLSSAEAL